MGLIQDAAAQPRQAARRGRSVRQPLGFGRVLTGGAKTLGLAHRFVDPEPVHAAPDHRFAPAAAIEFRLLPESSLNAKRARALANGSALRFDTKAELRMRDAAPVRRVQDRPTGRGPHRAAPG